MDPIRKRKILDLLTEHRYMSVKELCRLLYVSEPTVRRDLTALEKEGLVLRSHGGASLSATELRQPLLLRRGMMQKEKRLIGKAAADLLEDGCIIFLDTSTTAMSLIPELRAKKDITVITNGLPALNLLQSYHVKTKCTGGSLSPESMGFVGYQAEHFVSMLRADFMFFSTPSLAADGLISDHSEPETYLRLAMLESAKKSVFLFDQTKYGKIASFKVSDLNHIDYAITDMPSDLFTQYSCHTISINRPSSLLSH